MSSRDSHSIRHLVILGHPSSDSFNASVARAYCETVRACGQSAVIRDLYALGFDPLLRSEERPDSPDFSPGEDVEAELDLLRESDAVVLVYPIWFGMPPAIIKGYIDRVLGAGFTAAEIKTGAVHPFLEGKRLVLITSSGTSRPWLEERGMVRSLRQAWDIYLTTIFSMVDGGHLHLDVVVKGLQARFGAQLLEQVNALARQTCSTLLSELRARERQDLMR